MGKMFWRKQPGAWYCKLDGKFIHLGKDETQATQKWHKVMAERDPDAVAGQRITIDRLLKDYSKWLRRNRAYSTWERRLPHLKRFVSFTRRQGVTRAAKVRPYHVHRWVEHCYPTASPTYQNDLITAIQAGFQWGEDEGLLKSNPIRRTRKPARQPREDFIPRDQWRRLLRACGTREFRLVVWFGLTTGARAEEIPRLEAQHFDGDHARLILPGSKAKGRHRAKRKPRIIYLPTRMAERVSEIVAQNPTGPLFRNSDGAPWNKESLTSAFGRLKAKLEWPGSLCLTMLRHSFAHDHVRRGTDALVLAQLMGHRDTTMLARVYAHVGDAPDTLRDAVG